PRVATPRRLCRPPGPAAGLAPARAGARRRARRVPGRRPAAPARRTGGSASAPGTSPAPPRCDWAASSGPRPPGGRAKCPSRTPVPSGYAVASPERPWRRGRTRAFRPRFESSFRNQPSWKRRRRREGSWRSLLGQQRGDVVERFARAVRVVAVFVDQALFDHGDLLTGLVVRAGRRGDEAKHV